MQSRDVHEFRVPENNGTKQLRVELLPNWMLALICVFVCICVPRFAPTTSSYGWHFDFISVSVCSWVDRKTCELCDSRKEHI